MNGLYEKILFIFLFIAVIEAKKNLVTEFEKKTGASIFGDKEHSQFAILIESKESEDYDDFFDEFTKAAQKFEKKVRFVYINSDVEENWQVIEFLGLIAEDVPGVLFIDLEKGLKKYKAEMNEITKAGIIKFVQSCLDGEATAFLKSDEIPDDWNKGSVIELVGQNFEEQVFQSKKSTFVFFYAPWCTACQNTMPEIEKLGELYKDSKNIVIAKMNSITNEIPGLLILDVPTLALFVKGSRKPIYYTADERNVNDFSQFITTNVKGIDYKTVPEKTKVDEENTAKKSKEKKQKSKNTEKSKSKQEL